MTTFVSVVSNVDENAFGKEDLQGCLDSDERLAW
jgi:hypothetical protein